MKEAAPESANSSGFAELLEHMPIIILSQGADHYREMGITITCDMLALA
jgi:hypothetical protein